MDVRSNSGELLIYAATCGAGVETAGVAVAAVGGVMDEVDDEVTMGVTAADAGESARMTVPPHMTKVTRSICDKSANGSLSTAMISANKPLAIRPTRFSQPSNSAATLVAD